AADDGRHHSLTILGVFCVVAEDLVGVVLGDFVFALMFFVVAVAAAACAGRTSHGTAALAGRFCGTSGSGPTTGHGTFAAAAGFGPGSASCGGPFTCTACPTVRAWRGGGTGGVRCTAASRTPRWCTATSACGPACGSERRRQPTRTGPCRGAAGGGAGATAGAAGVRRCADRSGGAVVLTCSAGAAAGASTDSAGPAGCPAVSRAGHCTTGVAGADGPGPGRATRIGSGNVARGARVGGTGITRFRRFHEHRL